VFTRYADGAGAAGARARTTFEEPSIDTANHKGGVAKVRRSVVRKPGKRSFAAGQTLVEYTLIVMLIGSAVLYTGAKLVIGLRSQMAATGGSGTVEMTPNGPGHDALYQHKR